MTSFTLIKERDLNAGEKKKPLSFPAIRKKGRKEPGIKKGRIDKQRIPHLTPPSRKEIGGKKGIAPIIASRVKRKNKGGIMKEKKRRGEENVLFWFDSRGGKRLIAGGKGLRTRGSLITL